MSVAKLKVIGETPQALPHLNASISEIFSSLQGEGIHLGERHLFVRFETCNIHCEYCDELGKPGFGFDMKSVIESLRKLEQEKGPHSFVSFTGGEPLVYSSFLKFLLPRLKEEKFNVYLETNGILYQRLKEVIDWCDTIAMDVKPASVTKEKSFLNEHRHFLRMALERRPHVETFIKMVCSNELDLEEFKELCQMIATEDETVPLILQPISKEIEGHEDPVLMRFLSELQSVALGNLREVRIIPRLHRILKIR